MQHLGVGGTLVMLRGLLLSAEARDEEYVLFGSTVLYLHGLRAEVGDVDAFVSRRVYNRVQPWADREIEGPGDDPPLLEWDMWAPPLHVFYAWTERDREWMTVEECFARAETVAVKGRAVGPTTVLASTGPWRCIPIELLAQHKRLADSQEPPEVREKHQRDLAVIEAYLSARR